MELMNPARLASTVLSAGEELNQVADLVEKVTVQPYRGCTNSVRCDKLRRRMEKGRTVTLEWQKRK